MNILISGGTGLIGQELTAAFIRDGHAVWVLTRSPQTARLPAGVEPVAWDGKTTEGWGDMVAEMDVVVNLAGENIGDLPWSNERKQKIRQSRVDVGQAITQAVQKNPGRMRVLLQSSGIGYYGVSDNETFNERSGPGTDFVARMGVDWEESTRPVEALGVRRVILRSGVVLTPEGGALSRFLYAWRMFLGGPMGSGQQWISWIHLEDEIEAIRFLMEREDASGPFNLVSPEPVRNEEFGRTLAEVLNRPYKLPIPDFALKALLGEMSMMVLEGQRVIPQRLLAFGFPFKYRTLRPALEDLLAVRSVN